MDTSDRGLLDIERFDLEPERPIFHGLIGDVDPARLRGLPSKEKVESFLRTEYEGHERIGLLAFRQNRLVGYALITMGVGILAFERLGVVPDERRKRVGTKLITVAMLDGRVRGLETMSVVVRDSNAVAQRFFHECGFRADRITDELRGWFGTEDGVAMRRPVVLPMPGTPSP
jgi:ribosomal protein S18 acetylase RimI-like enzyme